MDFHHLYVISEGDLGPVKLGRSRNAFARLETLQIGNPRRLKVASVWEVPSDEISLAERILHEELSHFVLIGEWFSASVKFMDEYLPDFFSLEWY